MSFVVRPGANTSGESGTKSSYPFISYGYEGIAIDDLLESVDNVIFQLGDSQLNDEFKLRYDDLEFYHDNGAITSIVCTDPSLLEADGVPLNKNREGFISIFGQPSKEGNDGGGYYMSYNLPQCSMNFELGEPDSEAWRITVLPSVTTERNKGFFGEADQSMPDRIPGTVPSGLLYKGQPVMDLLGMKPEELNQIFGAPTGGTPVTGELFYGATEFYVYDEIGFMLNEQGSVSNITVGADQVELNGQTLNQNRDGILNLLGTPEHEEQLPEDESGEGLGGYYIIGYTTYDGGFLTNMTIQMPDAESIAYNVEISQACVD